MGLFPSPDVINIAFFVMNIIMISFFCFEAVTIIINLVKGFWQKSWEAKVITYICSVTILVTLILPSFLKRPIKTLEQLNPALSFFLENIGIIGMFVYPISVAIVLGRRNGMNHLQLINQVQSIEKLSAENLEKEREKKQILEDQNAQLEQKVSERTAELVEEKKEVEKQKEVALREYNRSEELLLNILPAEVAEELKQKGEADAKQFEDVTVLFTDFVNFTIAAERMTPKQLVGELDSCFKAFDNICNKYNIEKIKTVGDAYLAVSGLPVANVHHATDVVAAATEIIDFMQKRKQEKGEATFEIRIGINSGTVVAGIVGVKKFAYDIWGDTVNIAARMEQNSEAGKINISESTYRLVKDNYTCTHRGKIEAKNKGAIDMYFVESRA